MPRVLIFAESYFKERVDAPTFTAANAFARGVSRGAGYYGAGSCSAYVIPDDVKDMREFEPAEEVERALSCEAYEEI